MKKLLLGLLLIVILLVIVIAYKTSTFKSKQIQTAQTERKRLPMDDSAVAHLSAAVKFPTISFDNNSLSSERNATPLSMFIPFLREKYPLVFEKLQSLPVGGNTYSTLLKWQGSGPGKPVIFYAHMDVVPVEDNTLKEWKHEPFSGDIADSAIWGRGTLDDKGSLIAIFEAVNRLLAKGFVPQRTIYLAFGDDEEIGGNEGAEEIAKYLKQQGVKFEFYLDEGGMVSEGVVPNIKKPVALIGTAEKGYVTLELSVNMKGGHSSRPAKETALDVLVASLKKLHDNPDERKLSPAVNEFLQYLGPEMGMPLKAVFANQWLFKPLILNEYEKTAEGAALLRTTEVVTVVNAGVKENVIPTLVKAQVNYRVLTGQTTTEVIARAKKIINDDRVVIKAGELYEPSGNSSSATYGFQLIQQTCADVFPDAIVSPFLMLGSTDSKHFKDITENTYRFFPVRMNNELIGTIHGINERINTADFMETISFYETMMINLK